MKNKIILVIILLSIFGCKNTPEYSMYKHGFLSNISNMEFINKDSISIHQCRSTFGKKKNLSIKKGQNFVRRNLQGTMDYILTEINIKEKSITINYELSYHYIDKPVNNKGDFKVYNSEIKSCDFWKKI